MDNICNFAHMTAFDQINKMFDTIYVLTVPQAKERHQTLEKGLHGLNYQLFYGIYKADINIPEWINKNLYSEQEAIRVSRFNYKMRTGEIACSYGHKLIYEDVLKNKYKQVLILEDDAQLIESFENIAGLVLADLPKTWDMLMLDYDLKKEDGNTLYCFLKKIFYRLQRMWGGMKFNTTMIKNFYSSRYSTYWRKAGYHYFTDAYAVNQKACKVLLELQTPIKFPADHVIPWAITNEMIDAYIAVPKLFYQTSASNNYQNSLVVDK